MYEAPYPSDLNGVILGLYDHPSSDANIHSESVGNSNAVHFLYETQRQFFKWAIWAKRVWPPVFP